MFHGHPRHKIYCSRNELCYLTLFRQLKTGVLGFDSRRGLGIFLFTTASRTALGPTQPPNQWVPETLPLGVKWPGREAGHSPPSSTEVKEWVELYLHFPNTPLWHGAQLKHRDNFTKQTNKQGKGLQPPTFITTCTFYGLQFYVGCTEINEHSKITKKGAGIS
jgi:hypothetical protein